MVVHAGNPPAGETGGLLKACWPASGPLDEVQPSKRLLKKKKSDGI